jgi:AcrR family transcriptional regulator
MPQPEPRVASTRERALDAAVRLVGSQGVRALTHARVDAAAGLAKGSTSNHFRTRTSLLAGVIDHIAQSERADLAPAAAGPVTNVDEFVDAFTGIVTALTGPYADRTRARYALFLELASNPELQAPLRAQRAAFAELSRSFLASLGARNPDAAAQAFMAFGDGLILHRLTVDPDAAVRPSVAIAVRGCLAA